MVLRHAVKEAKRPSEKQLNAVELSTWWILRNIYFNNLVVAPVKTIDSDGDKMIFAL